MLMFSYIIILCGRVLSDCRSVTKTNVYKSINLLVRPEILRVFSFVCRFLLVVIYVTARDLKGKPLCEVRQYVKEYLSASNILIHCSKTTNYPLIFSIDNKYSSILFTNHVLLKVWNIKKNRLLRIRCCMPYFFHGFPFRASFAEGHLKEEEKSPFLEEECKSSQGLFWCEKKN